jgi:hypothetical protein
LSDKNPYKAVCVLAWTLLTGRESGSEVIAHSIGSWMYWGKRVLAGNNLARAVPEFTRVARVLAGVNGNREVLDSLGLSAAVLLVFYRATGNTRHTDAYFHIPWAFIRANDKKYYLILNSDDAPGDVTRNLARDLEPKPNLQLPESWSPIRLVRAFREHAEECGLEECYAQIVEDAVTFSRDL